jgi:hypothetical protein
MLSDTYFVLFNAQNQYLKSLIKRYNQLNIDISNNYQFLEVVNQNIMIISFGIMTVFTLILTALLGRTIFAKQIILSQFLEISETTAKYLYSKCENFLA